jgi:hypothetical protein
MADAAPAKDPILDIRVRWRAGQLLLGLAGVLTLVAFLRPLGPWSPAWLKAAFALTIGVGVSAAAFLASLRGRKPADPGAQHFLFGQEWQPDKGRVLFGGRHSRAGQYQRSVAQRHLGELARIARRQFHPQKKTALRQAKLPIGKGFAEQPGHEIAPRLQLVAAQEADLIDGGEQPHGNGLGQKRRTEIVGALEAGQPFDDRLGRAHPPGSQSRPRQFAQRPDREHWRGRRIGGYQRRGWTVQC